MMTAKIVILPEDIEEILNKDNCFLRRTGIVTITTKTNAEALALHTAMNADLIIAKLDTDDMTGESLCSRIREDHELSDVSIIMVCSHRKGDIKRSLSCNANTFVTTPINTAVLLQEAYQLLHIPPRTSCRVPIRIRVTGAAGERYIAGNAENISTSGMLFRTDSILEEGDPITCSFSISSSANISAKGEIVRIIEQDIESSVRSYGITFIELTHKSLSSISEFVDTHCVDT